MSNHYAFQCPVKGQGVEMSHCESVHSAAMQGKPQTIEDKVCALAHICFMCPFRCAVRVGGPWSHYDNKPHASEPMKAPAKLPKDLVDYALSHTTPNNSDYRRVGLWGDDVGKHDEFFRKIQRGIVSEPVQPKQPKKRKKAETFTDVIDDGGNDMADAVTDLAAKERNNSAQSATKGKTTQDKREKRKATAWRDNSPSARSGKPMSLAERAKLMKQRKSA